MNPPRVCSRVIAVDDMGMDGRMPQYSSFPKQCWGAFNSSSSPGWFVSGGIDENIRALSELRPNLNFLDRAPMAYPAWGS